MEHEGSCYWFSSSGKPWPEANQDCQLQNAHLVVVNSREEQVRLAASLGRLTGVRKRSLSPLFSPQNFIQGRIRPMSTWMGLTDQNGPWKWVDGTDYETGFK